MSSDLKIWSGRFSQGTESIMEEFSTSIHFDKAMFDADIKVNKAWAKALVQVNVYSEDDAKLVCSTLDDIHKDYHDGKLEFAKSDEDIHSANERWLTERLGDIGARIHTGRSRNDQVITDLRIYLRDQISDLDTAILLLQRELVALSEANFETVFAGQTHLRQAQPVSFAHYLLALFFQMQRNRDRLADYKKRLNKMPLGSGAIAGAAFEIDRQVLANELEFDAPTENSYDATSDRDFVLELLNICTQTMLHLSRMAEDFIIWSSESFGLLEIGEQYSTGSSMMPQKKNPDSLELIRGKCARVIGNQVTGLTMMKGIPTAYVRDLQEDKEPVFDSLHQTIQCILISKGVFETLTVNSERMLNNLDPALYATDLADYLVKKGIPFRKAHSIVGSVVARAENDNIPFNELEITVYQEYAKEFEPDLYNLFDPISAINKRNIEGGTGIKSIQHQIDLAKSFIA